MDDYHSIARNFSADSENQIHGADMARRYGFEGALVPGAAVFGHMTHPLVQAMGDEWMSGHRLDVRFIKPAYDRDALTIRHSVDGDVHTVRCLARGGTLLSELHLASWDRPPGPPPAASPERVADRPLIRWDNVTAGEAFPAFAWTPTAVENAEYAAQVDDQLALYRQKESPSGEDLPDAEAALVHPHAWLSVANRAFMRRYRLPAWIHVGSDLRLRRRIRVGDDVEVRAVPASKWRRKGHEFIELTVALVVGGEVAMEIAHTAIFRIAGAP